MLDFLKAMSSDYAANIAMILSGTVLHWLVTHVNTTPGLSLQGHAPAK